MSKFKDLFDTTKDETKSETKLSVKSEAKPLSKQSQKQNQREEKLEFTPKLKAQSRNVGKRSDPAYEQVTAYIRKDTYKNVKIALLKENEGQEFSELVEDLLSEWLESRN